MRSCSFLQDGNRWMRSMMDQANLENAYSLLLCWPMGWLYAEEFTDAGVEFHTYDAVLKRNYIPRFLPFLLPSVSLLIIIKFTHKKYKN